MGVIEIEGMRFFAKHGYYPSEKIVGNEFRANIIMEVNLLKAGKSDNLDDTVNYQKVYDIIKLEMNETSDLLENVAYRVIQSIKSEFKEVEKVRFKLSKMNPPMGGEVEKVSVTLTD